MNYNCTVRPKTTCDNMLYFQDNQLDCSCLKIHMALVELIHVFSYLNLNQEMPDNKCLFSEKNVSWNLLIGFSLKKSPIFMDTVKKWSSFFLMGVNLFGIVIIWRTILGSITSRCSGKWAQTHPPKESLFGEDQRPDPGDSGNRA